MNNKELVVHLINCIDTDTGKPLTISEVKKEGWTVHKTEVETEHCEVYYIVKYTIHYKNPGFEKP